MRHTCLVFVAFLGGCMASLEPRDVSADEPLPADLHAGDVVYRGDFSLVVPELGQSSHLIGDLDDGTSIELTIENPESGEVRLIEAPVVVDPIAISAHSALTECTDGAYNLEAGA